MEECARGGRAGRSERREGEKRQVGRHENDATDSFAASRRGHAPELILQRSADLFPISRLHSDWKVRVRGFVASGVWMAIA